MCTLTSKQSMVVKSGKNNSLIVMPRKCHCVYWPGLTSWPALESKSLECLFQKTKGCLEGLAKHRKEAGRVDKSGHELSIRTHVVLTCSIIFPTPGFLCAASFLFL